MNIKKTKNFICIAFFFLIPMVSFAAGVVEKGVKVGANVSKFWGDDASLGPKDDLINPKYKINMILGAYFIYDFGKKFTLQPEIYFLQTGAIYSSKVGQHTLNVTSSMYYLSIPILAAYNLRENVNLFFGPNFSFILSANEKSEFTGFVDSNINIDTNEFNSPDFGLILGASYQYPMQDNYLIFDSRLSLGLRSIDKSNLVDIKNLGLIFLIGFAF